MLETSAVVSGDEDGGVEADTPAFGLSGLPSDAIVDMKREVVVTLAEKDKEERASACDRESSDPIVPRMLTERCQQGHGTSIGGTARRPPRTPRRGPRRTRVVSNTISEGLVEDFRDEAASTRKYLERVPEERFDWKPHEKSMSLGQLAGHLAEAPGWIAGMVEDEFDMGSLEGNYVPFVPKSRAELLETLQENMAVFEQVVAGKDDEFLSKDWTMRQGDTVLLTSPRHMAIRRTGIHHWIHHRGQLGVYLRELGVDLPPIYGPTADDPSFG